MSRRFEKRHEKLISNREFANRILGFILLAVALEALTVFLGSLGFHYIEGLNWLDSCLDTAMVVTGNGPPYQAKTYAGKLFQITFGLIGVIVFALVLSVILVPVFHRVLHAFHVDAVDAEAASKDRAK